MKVQVYNFLAEEQATDHEKLFFWFITKIFKLGGAHVEYTIASYDLHILLLGRKSNGLINNLITPLMKKYFEFYFVTEERLIIRLKPNYLKSRFQSYRGGTEWRCPLESVEITKQSAVTLYVYILGLFAGSDSMFYDATLFGIGDLQIKYENQSKNLTKLELGSLLDHAAHVDPTKL